MAHITGFATIGIVMQPASKRDDVAGPHDLPRPQSASAPSPSLDLLTGLLNREEIEKQLGRTLQGVRSSGAEHALLLVRLNDLQHIDDTCGRTAGNVVLRQFAHRLIRVATSEDLLARLENGTFVVLRRHVTAEHACGAAQALCDGMDDYRFAHAGQLHEMNISVGVVPLDRRWSHLQAVLEAGEAASRAAADAGRNGLRIWSDTLPIARDAHPVPWRAGVAEAIDDGRFELFAQLTAPTGTTHGRQAEVLLRMLGCDGLKVPAAEFITTTEGDQAADRIDRWVLTQTLAWTQRHPELGGVATLSVNVSGRSVGDAGFRKWMLHALEQLGEPQRTRLCIEISELIVVTHGSVAKMFIEALRALGLRVALDKFGAAASSLDYLKTLSVDFLKIDGRFIRQLPVDSVDEAAVRCYVDLARLIGAKVVACCVETPAVLDRLLHLGVDFAQGDLIHVASPIDDLLSLRPRQATGRPAASDA